MFRFKNFSLSHKASTLKIGTDSVLLASVVPVDGVQKLLDIGCGCGVIALCLADKMRTGSISQQIIGIDIDESSIKESIRNKEQFPLGEHQQIEFFHTSLQNYAQESQTCFDLIVSNPPYFVNALKPHTPELQKSKHRDNNLSFNDLIKYVDKLLSENGNFYLILPPTEYEEFDLLAKQKWHLVCRWQIFPNPHKKMNRIIAGYTKKAVEQPSFYNLYIRNEKNDFGEDYRRMTSDFYLD